MDLSDGLSHSTYAHSAIGLEYDKLIHYQSPVNNLEYYSTEKH